MLHRLAIILAAALYATAPHAQTRDWRWDCLDLGAPFYPAPTTAAKPVCLPSPAGAGTAPIVEINESGMAGAWWCKGSSGKAPTLYLYAVRWDALTVEMLADATLVALSTAKTTAIQGHLAKYQTRDIVDMCEVWGPARERILAAKP